MSGEQFGSCCWIDLAARDAGAAASFYAGLFGWQVTPVRIGPGSLFRLQRDGEVFASMYQLDTRQIDAGVPSHWTPYIGVDRLEEANARAEALGGRVLVKGFEDPGRARVSLVVDPVGALIGLWQPMRAGGAGYEPKEHRA